MVRWRLLCACIFLSAERTFTHLHMDIFGVVFYQSFVCFPWKFFNFITRNVDAICSAGVSGLVTGMGELAAGAALGAATCDLEGVGLQLCERVVV